MPYKVPPTFFEQIAESTLAEAERREAAKKQPWLRMWPAMAVAATIALLLTVGYVLFTGKTTNEPTIAVTENKRPPSTPEKEDRSDIGTSAATEATAVAPETQTMAAVTKPADTILKSPARTTPPTGQQTKAEAPETLDHVLANVSDEELMLLAAVAETDLNLYEQTFEL